MLGWGVGDPESSALLDRRMTSWETKEIKRWMKTEARGREAESSTQQPAGKLETTAATAKATATVIAMRNASPQPSRDLVTTITTTTLSMTTPRLMLRGGQGAVGVLNDGDDVVGDVDPMGSTRRTPWSSQLMMRPCSFRMTPMVATAAAPSSAARSRMRSRGRGQRARVRRGR